jgi:Tol biopolymer transport system component/DNA-binding winged helix-turn-helix (wHTH) protein
MPSIHDNSVVFQFADFEVDPKSRVLLRNGEAVTLTPKVFETLLAFVEHAGETLSKEDLMNLIWPDSFVEESNLTQNVAVLRKALGENSRLHKYIVTVPGKGYRFVPEVLDIRDNGSESGDRHVEVSGSEIEDDETLAPTAQFAQRKGSARRSAVIGLAATVLLCVAAAVVYFVFPIRGTEAPTVLRTRQITSFSGLDLYPIFSPSGSSIAFSSNKSGAFEIYVKQLIAGASELQLTSDGNHNFQPAFSPDGSLIAYYSALRGGIWAVPAAGGVPKRITEFGSNPVWSPDGRRIAFQSDPLNDVSSSVRNAMPPSTIWTVSSDGSGEPVQLTEVGKPEGGHGAPDWSPDGKRIVFDSNDWASSRLWSVAVDGSGLKSLLPEDRADGSATSLTASEAVYTKDGRSLVYVGDVGLSVRIVDVSESGEAAGPPRKILDATGSRIRQLALSPEGKRLIYSAIRTSSNLMLTELNSSGFPSEPRPLTKSADSRAVSPSFSPDGKTIAYQEYTTGSSASIRLMDLDGGNQRQIAAGPGFNPWWFPEGGRVGYSHPLDRTSEYWYAAADGSITRKLFVYDDDDVYNGRLAPDGRSVLFNSKRSGTINIWQIPIEGGSARQLTFDAEMAGFPAASRDGKWIGMQLKRGSDTHVAYMPAEGGEPIQLTNEPGQSWVNDWAPDNDRILFAGRRGQYWNIYSVSRTTREVTKLTNFDKLHSYVRYPAWSPLNDRIAYEYAESSGNIWMIELK